MPQRHFTDCSKPMVLKLGGETSLLGDMDVQEKVWYMQEKETKEFADVNVYLFMVNLIGTKPLYIDHCTK